MKRLSIGLAIILTALFLVQSKTFKTTFHCRFVNAFIGLFVDLNGMGMSPVNQMIFKVGSVPVELFADYQNGRLKDDRKLACRNSLKVLTKQNPSTWNY